MQETPESSTREFSAWKSSRRLDFTVLRYVLLAIVIALFTFLAMIQIERLNEQVRRAQDLRLAVASVLELTIGEETGLRGSIATKNRLFLQPYYAAGPRLAALMRSIPQQLRALDIRDAQQPFANFAGTYRVWRREVASPSIARPDDPHKLALQLLGKELFDRMRNDLAQTDAAISDAATRIVERTHRLAIVASVLAALWVLAVGAVAIASERRRAAGDSALLLSVIRGRQSAQRLGDWRSKIIAMLAHDFKTQLAVLLGCTDLLEDFADRRDDRTVYDAMRRATRRLTEMTDEALLMARVTNDVLNVRKEPVALDDLLEETTQRYRNERPILVRSSANGVRVAGDAPYLARVLHNLLSNAVKYSPDGTPIDVLVSRRGPAVEIAIRDRGAGIGREELPHVFEEYWRSPNAPPETGTGIGLFIVKKIVEAHGGTVSIESRERQGTTVRVQLAAVD